MTKSHEIINTTCATEDAEKGWLFISSISAKTPSSSSCSYSISKFGRDTFELGIELVDNRLLLRIGASDVDGFRGKVAARAFILFLSVSIRRVVCGTRHSPQSNRLRSHSYVKEHSSNVVEDKMRWGNFRALGRV